MSSHCCFTLRDKNQFTVCVTIPNCFKSPHRSICFWAFCYWHFCKRRTSGHGAPDPVFPDGVQAQLHQYRLPGAPPVHQQREHLHRGPGSDREGAEVLSLQTRCSEHLLRPVRNGEYDPSGVLAATGVSAILTHPHCLFHYFFHCSHFWWLLKSCYNVFLLHYIMPPPSIPQCKTCQRMLILAWLLMIT